MYANNRTHAVNNVDKEEMVSLAEKGRKHLLYFVCLYSVLFADDLMVVG